MKELDLQEEFTLEDIIKEFGGTPLPEPEEEQPLPEASEEAEMPAEEELPAETLPDEPAAEEEMLPEPEMPMEQIPEQMPALEVTQEFFVQTPSVQEDVQEAAEEELPEEPVTSDTIRLDTAEVLKGVANNAVTIGDEEEEEEEIPAPPEQEEEKPAFTGEWEPEYEEPMGKYVPPQPIAFPPRTDIREVKRKLIVGPEKRYYELAEKGLGKLQLVIFLSFVVVVLSAVSTVMYAQGLVPDNRLRLMIFGQFMTVMVSALLGSFQLIRGVSDLANGRFTLNTLLLVTFFLCCADGVFCLMEERIPCCAAFSLEVLMSLWSTYQRRHKEMGQMDVLRKASRVNGLTTCPEGYEGKRVVVRIAGQVEDFMDNYNAVSAPEKKQDTFAVIALIFSVASGVFAGVTRDVQTGVRIAEVSLLAAVPATAFIATSRSEAILQRRLHRLGTVLCGWQGVNQLKGKVVFPVAYEDLFPLGSVRMNGVKFFGSRPTEQVLAYAAALVRAEGGGMAALFDPLLDSHNGPYYEAKYFRRYEGGIGATVEEEPVLAGSLGFLKNMGVEVPDGMQITQAVCVAVDGELCGVFAISHEKTRSATAGLSTLSSYRRLNPVIAASAFMLPENFVRGKFGIKSKRLQFPTEEQRITLCSQQPEEDAQAAILTTVEGLAPMAYGITGARSLRTACNLGVFLHMIGGVLGMAVVLALLVLGATHLLTPANMFLYQLVWLVPGFLVTEWTRSV